MKQQLQNNVDGSMIFNWKLQDNNNMETWIIITCHDNDKGQISPIELCHMLFTPQ